MKKVLIVIPSFLQGGGQKFVVDLANGIDHSKYQVKVLSYYKKSNSVFDQFLEEHNIDTIYLDKKVGLEFGFFKNVKKVLKDYSPDIIHTNLDSLLYLLPYYRRKQVKLHTVHTVADQESNKMQRFVRKIAFKLCGVIPVAISDTVSKTIADVYGMDISEIPVVYNGVDCKRYALEKNNSDKIRFITIGTIYHVKNYSFLVNCFAEICKEFNNLHLTIVGDGVLRQELEEQVELLGINDKITITGVVGDVENYLANADIYVASSIFEGLPISILEAMSAGLPIISTNVGGVPDIVSDNENGILVESDDKDGYIEALKRLIKDIELREKYAERSKELSRKYDLKNTVSGYEKLYQEK